MTYVQNLPTKSELYGNSNKNKEDFITLNIYNNKNLNIEEESNSDINQTETNLNFEDISTKKQREYLENLQKKAIFLDNTRNNQYPNSENREVQLPAPAPAPTLPIYKQNANFSKSLNPYKNNVKILNNYSKSVNPYNYNNFQTYCDNQNNNNQIYYYDARSTEKGLEPNTLNIPQNGLNQLNQVQNKKKKNKMTSIEICICILLFFIYPPASIIYYCCIMNKKKKKNNNN